ncbi:phosphopantetheinyl transferase [Erwinia sp. P6884]|uniref:4'-phosphopantetheinyl transferase family protein n=1 Tax=Erwinia sp. P6884 TaxID=3141450 RepID=UPI003198C77A
MASHFARWTLNHTLVPARHLPDPVVNLASSLPEKRRARYLASRVVLAALMQQIYGIAVLPEITMSSNGRPCFADPELPDFSIAYAGNIVGVLLADEEGHGGLGMEFVRAHSRQAIEQLASGLSSGEKAWIRAQADPYEAATQLWAIRQSVLKLSDKADHGTHTLRLLPASGRLRSQAFPDTQAISDVEDLLVWSCAFSRGSDRLHLWDYDGRVLERRYELLTASQHVGPQVLRLTSLPLEK